MVAYLKLKQEEEYERQISLKKAEMEVDQLLKETTKRIVLNPEDEEDM